MRNRYKPIVGIYHAANLLFPVKKTMEASTVPIDRSYLEKKNQEIVYSHDDPLIRGSIQQGVDFLANAQLPSGEFAVREGDSLHSSDWKIDSSPFISCFILHSLDWVRDDRIPGMKAKSIQFVLENREPDTWTWRYWSRSNWKHGRLLRPDIDDTAVCRTTLMENRVPFPDHPFLPSQNADGSFFTWLGHAWEGWPPVQTIDGVVNANVAHYLHTAGTHNTFLDAYLISLLSSTSKLKKSLRHYKSQESFEYAFTRAYRKSTQPSIQEALHKIKWEALHSYSLEKINTLTDFQLAMITCTLLNVHSTRKEIEPFIRALVVRQASNGSWRSGSFYTGLSTYYGSPELTTGLALEALGKYLLDL